MAKTNILKKVGDILIVEVKPKFDGRLTLNEYSDKILGTNARNGITTEFRVISDSLFYDDWKTLNNENVNGVIIKPNQIIQVKYTRITENNGNNNFIFQSVDFNGEYESREYVAPILNSSIFSDTAWKDDTERLAQNLFKKLYFRGIVPNYIKRGANLTLKEDEDYQIFFGAISKFFAIILNFFKRFEHPYTDFELLKEIVKQSGINFNEGDITLKQLQDISRNIYDEIRKRGTKKIFDNDGEFSRLIRHDKADELLYENVPKSSLGWCLGKSSPMYRGVSNDSIKLNKTGEITKDFQNIDNFSVFGSVLLKNTDGKKVINVTSNGGLGINDNSQNIKFINIDPHLDYEISFFIRFSDTSGNLNVRVDGFDNLKNKLNDSFVHPNNDSVSDYILQSQPMSKFNRNVWYRFSCILHAYYSENSDSELNIGFGNNLYFNNPFIKYIVPNIYINGGGEIDIWNYKIKPLVRGTNILPIKGDKNNNAFSLGFIQAGSFFHAYFKNNNNNQSDSDVADIIERYLLPYSSTNILTVIK